MRECKSQGILMKDPNPVYLWDNDKTGDEQLIGWYTKEGLVIETNGDPVWETEDGFDELWRYTAAEVTQAEYRKSYSTKPLPRCCANCSRQVKPEDYCYTIDKPVSPDGYCPLWLHNEKFLIVKD